MFRRLRDQSRALEKLATPPAAPPVAAPEPPATETITEVDEAKQRQRRELSRRKHTFQSTVLGGLVRGGGKPAGQSLLSGARTNRNLLGGKIAA